MKYNPFEPVHNTIVTSKLALIYLIPKKKLALIYYNKILYSIYLTWQPVLFLLTKKITTFLVRENGIWAYFSAYDCVLWGWRGSCAILIEASKPWDLYLSNGFSSYVPFHHLDSWEKKSWHQFKCLKDGHKQNQIEGNALRIGTQNLSLLLWFLLHTHHFCPSLF